MPQCLRGGSALEYLICGLQTERIMKPAALLAMGVAALMLMATQAAPTGHSKDQQKDIFDINQEAGLLGRDCPGFKCDIDCDFGYDTDEDGCFVCSCIPENRDVIFEGDIVLDEEGKNIIRSGDSGNRTSIDGQLWPGGVIPYAIEDSIGPSARDMIRDTLRYAQHIAPCISFPQRTNEAAYISFYKGSGCTSPVGYRAGRVNAISLAPDCMHQGMVSHELLHSLGFSHEQNRPDRDNYVEILWDNIPKGLRYNFNKLRNINSVGRDDGPYDYMSLMHYGSTTFGGGEITIRTRDASKQHLIGNRWGLSDIDSEQLRLLYDCPARSFTKNGGSGGTPWNAAPTVAFAEGYLGTSTEISP
ncbi:hatching enzyme 1.2-like isoform X2 [Branchiostoma floridae x Branchiostoma japonicum]